MERLLQERVQVFWAQGWSRMITRLLLCLWCRFFFYTLFFFSPYVNNFLAFAPFYHSFIKGCSVVAESLKMVFTTKLLLGNLVLFFDANFSSGAFSRSSRTGIKLKLSQEPISISHSWMTKQWNHLPSLFLSGAFLIFWGRSEDPAILISRLL